MSSKANEIARMIVESYGYEEGSEIPYEEVVSIVEDVLDNGK